MEASTNLSKQHDKADDLNNRGLMWFDKEIEGVTQQKPNQNAEILLRSKLYQLVRSKLYRQTLLRPIPGHQAIGGIQTGGRPNRPPFRRELRGRGKHRPLHGARRSRLHQPCRGRALQSFGRIGRFEREPMEAIGGCRDRQAIRWRCCRRLQRTVPRARRRCLRLQQSKTQTSTQALAQKLLWRRLQQQVEVLWKRPM